MHDYQEIKPSFQSLPVELVAAILSQLDLGSLQACAFVSPRLRSIASDPLLNPWRAPILRALLNPGQENSPGDAGLKNMSVLSSVPRHNWIEILVFATPEFLLFQATLPNLTVSLSSLLEFYSASDAPADAGDSMARGVSAALFAQLDQNTERSKMEGGLHEVGCSRMRCLATISTQFV